jgi:hypothetical protein
MNKERNKIYWIIGGALLFNGIFWNEKMAVNTVLYDLFIIGVLFSLYPKARHSSTVRWLLAGHLICLAMIVINNSMLSKFAFTVTLFLLTGFTQYVHRSAWYAGGSVFQNIVFSVPGFFEALERPKRKKGSRSRFSKLIWFVVLPFFLVLMFFIIYSNANSVFSNMATRFGTWVENFLNNFFDFFNGYRLLFFLLGLFITTFILLRSKLNYFSKKEEKHTDDLLRIKKTMRQKMQEPLFEIVAGLLGKFATGIMAIKNMNTVGLISLVLLNILLLVVNSIDISYIWFGFNAKEVNLYEMIHEGADLLIFSMVMAILVLLIFFRGNLNFYRNNKWLKWGAYCWIFQNIILVISVFLRDYHYIRETGLAYKRIGVLFYLALVLVGLITVFWKIYHRKTVYYLFRVNAWAVIVLLIFSTTINWDYTIAAYNLGHKNEIIMPVDYMVTLKNKALPLLDQHKEDLKRHQQLMKEKDQWKYNCDDCFLRELEINIAEYKEQNRNYSWLSWNMSDAAIGNYFQNKLVVR